MLGLYTACDRLGWFTRNFVLAHLILQVGNDVTQLAVKLNVNLKIQISLKTVENIKCPVLATTN